MDDSWTDPMIWSADPRKARDLGVHENETRVIAGLWPYSLWIYRPGELDFTLEDL